MYVQALIVNMGVMVNYGYKREIFLIGPLLRVSKYILMVSELKKHISNAI